MPFRLTVQDNESTSLRNMAKLYDGLPIDNIYKTEFHNLKGHLNNYLDSPTIISENNEPTRRQIFEAFMWGEYAHRNPDKREILELWKTVRPHWDMVYNQFEMILYECINVISKIKGLNERVLKQYSNSAS
ncbi:MAG TPA: hypothetical protein VE572_04950 [Nitrososphaeraceae archaeon]|nr:hypothetical protein [Nitrososphaeraceae archaeon]